MSLKDEFPIRLDQIRLVTVCPPSDYQDDPVRCNLEVLDLAHETQNMQYTALSYTWGAPAEYGQFSTMTSELKCPIIRQGTVVRVAENLAHFLNRVQHTPSLLEKKFWIDSICIDQENDEERAHQVKLMSHIYSSANGVVTWMGEEDEYTGTAFKALKRIHELILDGTMDESPAYLRRGENRLGLDVSDGEAWRSVGKFFQRCYFNRSWTIQEVILGKEIEVICGGEKMNWEVLITSSRFFSQTGWKGFLDNLSVAYPEEIYVPAYYMTKQHWTTTLLYALQRSRDYKATDPRDKVFSMLGLVGKFIKDKPRLAPAYGTQSVTTTYTNVAIQLLEDGEDLYILSCVEGELFQRVGKLPSWVPDWTCGKSTGLLIIGYKRYSAAGTITQRPYIDSSALTVSLKGAKIDEVTLVGEAKHEVLDGLPFLGWLEIVASLPQWYRDIPEEAGGESRLEVFWRTLLRNTTGRPPILIPTQDQGLHHAFETWLRDKTRDRPKGMTDAKWESMSKALLELLGPDDIVPISDLTDTIGFHTRLSWAKHLRLFRTRTGYLGLGSECVQEGDSVWIIPSSRVPLILRPVDNMDKTRQRYRLVGGTYLHGVMHGEMVCPCCSVPGQGDIESRWETILIE
ncbi:HET-domain-containing protein [Aspergillus sclerotioniger CBS 115572]|uniref:HET-domain-containing protein n=1 Tax=Aspergillus sclerotioniger CBS 115572 TaxID=1450535 RepID=A0A317V670_9EURO|nr:HET-domain-containing protein [Aspergillus sclerotioniger CBS 115572]PWY67650.1 HET-domain-containing protein [Aspergillus sclerotioniger CBS 115572]